MSNRHALVVDDSKTARVTLKRMLEQQNLDVDTLESAQEALDYLESFRPGSVQVSTEAVTGWPQMTLRTAAVAPLMNDVADQETMTRFHEPTLAIMAERGIVFGDDHPVSVQITYFYEGMDAA